MNILKNTASILGLNQTFQMDIFNIFMFSSQKCGMGVNFIITPV